ncbi:hypothetical protein PMAYCL1PPCAC_20516, partial [Pristionchus mayeri]
CSRVTMADELSPIEQLPEEILHEIIDNAPESIPALKLVSKIFNDRVDAYVKRARANRLVDRLDLEWLQVGLTRVTVGLPLYRVHLFKLRLNHFVISDVFPWSWIDSSYPEGRNIVVIFFCFTLVYPFNLYYFLNYIRITGNSLFRMIRCNILHFTSYVRPPVRRKTYWTD